MSSRRSVFATAATLLVGAQFALSSPPAQGAPPPAAATRRGARVGRLTNAGSGRSVGGDTAARRLLV